jgi:hypothetical protein
MVRTAAVVGTTTATRNAVNRRQADKNAADYAQAMNTYEQQTAPQKQQAPPRRRRSSMSPPRLPPRKMC